MAKTLYQKLYDAHVVHEAPNETPLLYIDRHLVHEVTSPQAFDGLRAMGRKVRQPGKTFATMDHNVSTQTKDINASGEMARIQMQELIKNCAEFGVSLYDLNHPFQGIVHVIGPEQGMTLPGMTIVCGDSHTATHGAFGSLAFGIGTSEVEHVLATQTLKQGRAKTMKIEVTGDAAEGITAKDIVLAVIGKTGSAGGTGHVVEFCGKAIEALSMEGRMTLCNMAIEMGQSRVGRAGRHHLRLPEGASVRTDRRKLGAGGRLLAHAEVRRRRPVRYRGDAARRRDRAAGHLGHQSRPGDRRQSGDPGAGIVQRSG